MSDAALSDAIVAIALQGTDASFAEFVEMFLDAKVGLVASNLPAHLSPGEIFQTGPNDRVTLALVGTPDGRTMIKACADPAIFVQRYPETKITALIVGRDLLQMLAKVPEPDGVLVCCATSFQSVPIGRAEAARALMPRLEGERRPWWKLWR